MQVISGLREEPSGKMYSILTARREAPQGCLHFTGCGAVDSALGLGPRGRRFESFHPDQEKLLINPPANRMVDLAL